MLRHLMLAALAIGCIAALSGASQPSAGQPAPVPGTEATGPTLATDLGDVTRHGPYLSVDAAFLRVRDGGTIKTLPISLIDGETVVLSIPGFPEQSFQFVRHGDGLSVSVMTAPSLFARVFG